MKLFCPDSFLAEWMVKRTAVGKCYGVGDALPYRELRCGPGAQRRSPSRKLYVGRESSLAASSRIKMLSAPRLACAGVMSCGAIFATPRGY